MTSESSSVSRQTGSAARAITLPGHALSLPLTPVQARLLSAAASVSLGVGVLAVFSQITIPLPFTPVPVTLGTFAALGVGAALGTRRGVLSTVAFALLAAAGAPILSHFSGGLTPTWGYVAGYIPAAAVAASAARENRSVWARMGLMLLASALIYVPGLPWLKFSAGLSWAQTLSLGALPFLIGDTLKSLTAALLTALPALRARRSHL